MLALLWLVVGCGRIAFDQTQRGAPDASADANPAMLGFVQHFYVPCALVETCTIATPATGDGHLLLVTTTYNSSAIHTTSVEDDHGQSFVRTVGPVAWSPTQGDYNTELWWGRAQGTGSITITLSGIPTSFWAFYVSEMSAAAIDQTAVAVGSVNGPTMVSSGTRDISVVPTLLFGHGEGQGATVLVPLGFTPQADDNANIEETKLVTSPGAYDAQFKLDGPGDWLALMVTLQ